MANVPVAGEPFTFTISLLSQTTGQILLNPTISSPDVVISTDGGALSLLATTPTVVPAGSGIVQVDLTANEVGTDRFSVIFEDAFGDEWKTTYYHEVISNASGGGGGGSIGASGGVLSANIEVVTLTGEIKEK